MMRAVWTILLMITFALPHLGLKAQTLTFCLDHTPSGLPLGSGKQFELERHGQEIEFLYRTDGPIRQERIYFFIDYFQDGKFIEFDTKSLNPDHNKSWMSYAYRFQRTGKYRVLMLDGEKKEICRSELEVNVRQEEHAPSYYQGAKIQFAKSVSKGRPDTVFSKLVVPVAQAETLAVMVSHYRPLKTKRIYVDVWVGSGEGQGMYLQTIEYSLDPAWTYSQFPFEFKSAGVYTFMVYTEDEIWIASGKLEVTMR
jgi:hypothetical protein